MSRDKQIEEIEEALRVSDSCKHLPRELCNKTSCSRCEAELLYDAGLRKQSEGEWIYKFTLEGDRFYECSVCGRQEVVNCLCKKINIAEDRPYCHCGAKMIATDNNVGDK